jgi:hypothetical protein
MRPHWKGVTLAQRPCEQHRLPATQHCNICRQYVFARNNSIYKMRMDGETLEKTAYAHGLTRERVRQIVAKINRQIMRQLSGTKVRLR